MTRTGFRMLALTAVCAAGTALAADAVPRQAAQAVRVARPPVVDADLTDEAWQNAPEITGFTQHDPEDGKASTQKTTVKVVYDDAAIYFGAKLEDSGKVTTNLGRRDNSLESDWFRIFIDSQYDRLSGAAFWVNPSNVQVDMILFNDIYDDWSWDAVWSSSARIVPGGWVAEVRIPYSQLRFAKKDVQTWGINFARVINRNNESAWLVDTPKSESGRVSRFADLTGIAGINPERSFEVVPYGVARSDLASRIDSTNPFAERMTHKLDGGVDVKYGITSNLTLTGTINPDFGQVEVDPAVVNLSQFETFFPEKRPFFTEGAQMFGFGNGPANSRWGFNFGAPTYFYSRRIGRSPQGFVAADYVDTPGETTILGAAKITGKFGKGWSVGVLDALTNRETAEFAMWSRATADQPAALNRGFQTVEPMTNYLVARTAKEYGNSRLGLLFTSVNRRIPQELTAIRSDAFMGGVDGYTLFKKKSWIFEWLAVGSLVQGSAAAITATQTAPAHQYQRLDAGYLGVDPTRTSLDGWGGRAMLAKQTGKWRPNIQVQSYSPGFEVNDLGFMQRADMIATHAVIHYLSQDVTKRSRERSHWIGKFQNWNHGGDLLADGIMGNAFTLWNNYWYSYGWAGYSGKTMDDRKARGSYLVENAADYWVGGGGGNDSRKKISFELEGETWQSVDGSWSKFVSLDLNYRPSSNVRLALSPSYSWNHDDAQYVTRLTGDRQLFGEIDQRTFELGTRAEWTVSSRLSFQLYLQPFIASGDYHDFKELAQPRTRNYTPAETSINPDFNLRSVRGSAVARWEFRPGSALYVVWNENRSEVQPIGNFRFGRDMSAIATAPSQDVFLIKVSYWLPI